MTWLANAHVVDLTGRSNGAGNGPFGGGNAGPFLGVVLHCNGATGTDTPDQFFIDGGGADSVCPNFQVHADGTIAQYLPLEWSPWCQANGNANYAAIETAGGADPLNPAQLASVARIVRAYHDVMGMPLQLANIPGERGLGYHAMGGADWGGHPCPLPARIAQRTQILQLASSGESTQSATAIPIGDDMSAADVAAINAHTDAAMQAQQAWITAKIGGTIDRAFADHPVIQNLATVPKLLRDTACALGGQLTKLPDGTVVSSIGATHKVQMDELAKLQQSLTDLADKVEQISTQPSPPASIDEAKLAADLSTAVRAELDKLSLTIGVKA